MEILFAKAVVIIGLLFTPAIVDTWKAECESVGGANFQLQPGFHRLPDGSVHPSLLAICWQAGPEKTSPETVPQSTPPARKPGQTAARVFFPPPPTPPSRGGEFHSRKPRDFNSSPLRGGGWVGGVSKPRGGQSTTPAQPGTT